MHQIDPMNRKRATAVLMDFCHTKLRFQGEKNILGTSLGKSSTAHAAKKSNLIILRSEQWDAVLPGLDWSNCIFHKSEAKGKLSLVRDKNI